METKKIRLLFQQLIWPATAGNVVWSFFTIFVEADWRNPETYALLSLLLLLSIYLVDEWYRAAINSSPPSMRYWVGDGILLIPIVILCIAATKPPLQRNWLEFPLMLAFAITCVGHLLRVWSNNVRRNWLLFLVNFGGIVILALGRWLIPWTFPFDLPISLFVVLGVWFIVHRAHPATA